MNYGYDYGYDVGSTVATGVAGMIGSILIISAIMMVVLLVSIILTIIGQWRCFKKAGYKGWEALIGGHNQFVNCTFAGVNPILVLVFMFGSVITIIPVIGWLIYLGFLIYYQVVVGINTAKVFGKGTGFGVALAIPISAPVAWFILGKDTVQYVGVKKDNNVEQNTTVTYANENIQQPVQPVEQSIQQPVQPVEQSIQQPIQSNICPNCGATLRTNDKFCMYCGKQL